MRTNPPQDLSVKTKLIDQLNKLIEGRNSLKEEKRDIVG